MTNMKRKPKVKSLSLTIRDSKAIANIESIAKAEKRKNSPMAAILVNEAANNRKSKGGK